MMHLKEIGKKNTARAAVSKALHSISELIAPRISEDMHLRINMQNLKTAHAVSLVIAILETLTLFMSVNSEYRTRNVVNSSFCAAVCIIMFVLTHKNLREKYNDLAAVLFFWFFYVLMVIWSLMVSSFNYFIGRQLTTFYIVVFCFTGFFYLRPVIGVPMILASYYAFYRVLYAVDGAKDVVVVNTALFAVLSAVILIIRYRFKVTDLRHSDRIEKLNSELKHLSHFDILTDMQNRRAFDGNNSSYIGRETTVIMCDVNDFKYVNDEFGHAAGDNVLKMISRCIKENITDTDCYRYGGDEFLIILTDTSDEEIDSRIAAFRNSLPLIPDTDLRLTVSTGYAHGTPSSQKELDVIIKLADEEMYKEKVEYHKTSPFRR